uniref:(northern house mosquito) hypothetical protein n=1 Tax=Culex pipiens TaxID=7175 RepID=A0A8D8F7X3_CULPI
MHLPSQAHLWAKFTHNQKRYEKVTPPNQPNNHLPKAVQSKPGHPSRGNRATPGECRRKKHRRFSPPRRNGKAEAGSSLPAKSLDHVRRQQVPVAVQQQTGPGTIPSGHAVPEHLLPNVGPRRTLETNRIARGLPAGMRRSDHFRLHSSHRARVEAV